MDKIKSFLNYFKRHKRIQYLSVCMVFAISFISVLSLGITHRYDTDKPITKVYQHTSLSSNEMILTKRCYNPKTKLYRLDFYIQSEGGNNTDNRFISDKLSVNNVSPEDPAKRLPTTLIRVTPQYYVMYVKNVPTKEMRTELNYTPSFTSSNDTSIEENIKMYSSSKDTKTDSNLKVIKDKNTLQVSLIDYQMYSLDQKIKSCDKSIKKHNKTIDSLNKEIDSIEKDLKFEIGEEKENSTDRIENLNSKIEEEEQTINDKKAEKTESKKQKILLEEQKKSLIEK